MKRSFLRPVRAMWLEVGLLGAVLTAVAVTAASCGGTVKVDDDSAGAGAGGEGGASSATNGPVGPAPVAQSTGNSTGGTTVVATGVGASGPVSSVGPGPGGPQVASATGMPPCVTCSELISGFEGDLCPQSEQLFEALLGCVCNLCSFQCQGTCNGGGMNSPQCDSCVESTIQESCSSQFSSCANDA